MGKVYKSMQGKEVDMEALMTKHETMPAVGNIRVNARGDELGPNGQIIKRREDILSEYYDNNPSSISDEELSLSRVKIKSVKKETAEPRPVVDTKSKPIEEKVKIKSEKQNDN